MRNDAVVEPNNPHRERKPSCYWRLHAMRGLLYGNPQQPPWEGNTQKMSLCPQVSIVVQHWLEQSATCSHHDKRICRQEGRREGGSARMYVQTSLSGQRSPSTLRPKIFRRTLSAPPREQTGQSRRGQSPQNGLRQGTSH